MSKLTSRKTIDQSLPKLFIGPWVGEFGIELLHWQGVARSVANSREWGDVIASSWPDREYIYSDFVDDFVPYTPPTHHVCGASCRGYDENSLPWKERFCSERGDVWLTPFGKPKNYLTVRALAASHSTFIDFSERATITDGKFDLLIHARATQKHNQNHKNWPVANWERLVSSLPGDWKVASIGDPNGAHKILGTTDLRGISLQSLASHCKKAKMLVGPSSGPIHFAIHSRLPVVIWMGEHRHHYFPQWNPFDVPIACLDTWQPSVDSVLNKIRDIHFITKSQRSDLRYLVAATKRSGHHAVTEWLANLNPGTEFVWLNDCVSDHVRTYPNYPNTIPSRSLLPKNLNDPRIFDTVISIGTAKDTLSRIISIEGASVKEISLLPEAESAQYIVFVLRDAANLASSLQKGFPIDFGKFGYLGSPIQKMLATYREYLCEATGRTAILERFGSKVVFVSYNRWHTDPTYRSEISNRLGTSLVDTERGTVARYGPLSGFEAPETSADQLKTLSRWESGSDAPDFWTACRDSHLHQMELEFHEKNLPIPHLDNAFNRLGFL
ncbi:MAG: hypothetical protein KDN18_01405 [Verrucomicrobiae bacterium]|nr:hypothetical protein [Verrucomicrobiae bacterium]